MIKIFAHRGNQEAPPENSLAAFEQAIQVGADGIECDVHLTADQALVILHDETLDRTTDHSGQVGQMTLDQIQEARLWGKDGLPSQQQIPQLEELLSLLERMEFQGVLNLELKTDQVPYPGIEARVLETVARYQPAYPVVYSSFNWETLLRLRQLAPKARIAALLSEELLPYIHHLPRLSPEAVHLDWQLFRADILDLLAAYPLRLWTVNQAEDWQQLMALAPDQQPLALMTDYPGQARKVLLTSKDEV